MKPTLPPLNMPQIIRMKPTGDLCLIEPIKTKPNTTIHIPDTHHDKPSEGIVLRVGPQVEEPKVNDHVLFDRFHGEDIKVGNQMLKLFHASEILAVIE